MNLLLVDDDPKFRATISRGLEDSGFSCDSAASAVEALEATRRAPMPYDLILLDVMMAGKSGWEFLEELRADGDDTPVIFLTACQAVDERVHGLRLGADDYVIKPFELTELLARIDAVLRRTTQTRLSFGPLRLDPGRRTVEGNGHTIELTQREFLLLHALLEARGQPLSRAELLSRVWGMSFDPETNVVEVQVARLRRKLERVWPAPIETVVGTGYRLAIGDEA